MPFGEIRERGRQVRERAARYLREAMLDLLGLDERDLAVLKSPPFDEPLGHWPLVKYVRGQLLGPSPTLAASGYEYPIFSWRTKIEDFAIDDLGQYSVTATESMTACFGEGIVFRRKSLEVWAP